MHPLGVHSHLFRGAPAAVAAALARHGLGCVQLSPSFPGRPLHDPGQITAERCCAAAAPFHDAGVRVAAVSSHVHLMEPDLDRRHADIMRWHALIRHCRDFGTPYLVTETGSLHPASPCTPHPPNQAGEAWAELCLILDEALELAADFGVTLLLKPAATHVLASPADALRLRAQLAAPHLGFVMDVANFALGCPPGELAACLDGLAARLGPWAPLVHATDLRFEPHGVVAPAVGRGTLDYARFLRAYREHQPAAPIILEHLRPDQVGEARAYLERALA